MNKKLVVVAALILGAMGMFLAQGTRAQDANATDNSAMNADTAMNADNAAADNMAK